MEPVRAMLTDFLNSYNVNPEELFDLFGKFGPIRYVPNISSGFELLQSRQTVLQLCDKPSASYFLID
jgi:RNA recognition motif-containing protein